MVSEAYENPYTKYTGEYTQEEHTKRPPSPTSLFQSMSLIHFYGAKYKLGTKELVSRITLQLMKNLPQS